MDYNSRATPFDLGNWSYQLSRFPILNLLKLHKATDRGNGTNDLTEMFLQYMRQSDEKFNTLLAQLNQPKPQSEIEKLVMTTAVERLMNPQQQGGNVRGKNAGHYGNACYGRGYGKTNVPYAR